MSDDPNDRDGDPFRPPEIPTEVCCLHCGKSYESYLIEWRVEVRADGEQGFWCCPTPGCDGKGFGFDLLPTDADYHDECGGWKYTHDGDEDLEETEDVFGEGADPEPPGRDEDNPYPDDL